MSYSNKLVMTSINVLLLAVAVINIVLFTFTGDFNISEILTNSAAFVFFAAVIFAADRIFKSEFHKYNTYNILICVLIVFVVLRYYAHIGPAVWTAAFILILLSITRNSSRMIAAVAFTVIGLGIYVWAADLTYTGGTQYYAAQFILFAIAFILCSGILSINVERFNRTRSFLSQSELAAQVSSDLITISPENLEEKVREMLKRTSTYFGTERAVIFLLSEDQKTVRLGYEWRAESLSSEIKTKMDFDISSSPAWSSLMTKNTMWMLPNVDVPKITDHPDIIFLREMHVKALISAPIIVKGNVYGALIYESFNGCRDWNDEHVKMLTVMANLLKNAFSRVEAEKEINKLALYDILTGLPNRYHFNVRLNAALETARKKQTRLAVIFIDLDSFKSVNDMVGHEAGDVLLRQVGASLQEHLGEDGVVARLGGDEFIILLPDIGITDDIKETADAVMAAFRKPFYFDNQEFFVTASAGVAVYPYDGNNSSMLRKNADLAMYAAKEQGKNQVAFCTQKLKDDVDKKVRISNLLHRAQERNELVVYYQPLVDIAKMEIVGVEALLRWVQPELGSVPPNIFIPLAEQTGLIFPIGQWVLKEACRQNKAWQDAGYKPIRMAVNLSVEQFRRTDIVDMIREVLDETGLDPVYLELEITESVAGKETNYIRGLLTAIRDLGVSISIDDFGTEYSSLARIKGLPIDRIKMAMEFVHGISVSEKDEAIAKIIINLAGNLGLKVVAEGVETEHQFEFLKDRVCDEVQGYYFYKPMPASDMENNLSRAEVMLESPAQKNA